ncbi:MAG: type II secretion system protein GspL [Acidovorax sp.]
MSTLLLHLPPAPDGDYGYTLTADGHSAQRHGQCAPALLPDPGRAGETVAVVPVRALSWQRIALPQGLPLNNAQRLRAVLEGLLEDRLLDEPAQLHFALQPGAKAGEAAWVAVCDRAWLRAHVQALDAAGRPVARIVPEFAPGALGEDAAQYHALGTPEEAHILATAQGADQGLTLLPLAAAPLLLPQDPDAAPVQAEPAVAALAERLLGRPVQIATASDRALRAARGDWDLAQFDLAGHSGGTRALRKALGGFNTFLRAPQWRAARWGAALLAVAHLTGLNAWAWQERQSLKAQQTGIQSALTQTFPQIKVVVDAPVQMEREVARLRQATGSVSPRDLEPLMAAAGQALPPGAQPTGLEYANGELRLRGVALPPDAATPLRERLGAAGYRAQVADNDITLRTGATP